MSNASGQLKFVAFASGGGSTVDFLCEAIQRGELQHRLVGVISDSSKAGVREICRQWALPFFSVSPRDFESYESWDKAITECAQDVRADFILLAGFLKKIGPQLLAAYPNRILNTHPSLLPAFGGHGMYGRRVHEAVISTRAQQTGVTIHLVNEYFDQGRPLHQARISVDRADTAETLEMKVKALEKLELLKFLNNWSAREFLGVNK